MSITTLRRLSLSQNKQLHLYPVDFEAATDNAHGHKSQPF
jgi:hypothetical protein